MKIAVLFAGALLLAGCGPDPRVQEQIRVTEAMRALDEANSLDDFLDVELDRPAGPHGIDREVIAQKRRQWYIENHTQLSPEMRQIILAGQWRIGMTKDDLYASRGVPWTVNRTVSSGMVFEQVVYGRLRQSYFYFENGIMTNWQD